MLRENHVENQRVEVHQDDLFGNNLLVQSLPLNIRSGKRGRIAEEAERGGGSAWSFSTLSHFHTYHCSAPNIHDVN